MNVRRVGAREANQQFSALLAAAERNGETIVITRRGKAVARLIPEPPQNNADGGEWLSDLIDRYGRPSDGAMPTRADIYDRGKP